LSHRGAARRRRDHMSTGTRAAGSHCAAPAPSYRVVARARSAVTVGLRTVSPRPDSLRDVQSQLEQALLDTPDLDPDAGSGQPDVPGEAPNKRDERLEFFSAAALAEVDAWRAGGPLPTSAEGLECMDCYIYLEDAV
jgi:hypothetical protein